MTIPLTRIKNESVTSGLVKSVERFFFNSKIDALEGKIIGPLLVAFFKCEERLHQLLTVSQFFLVFNNLGKTIDIKDVSDFFTELELRKNIRYAKSLGLIDEKIAAKFHALHDQRNSLSHFKGNAKRPLKTFTEDIQKQFLKDCSLVRRAIDTRVEDIVKTINEVYKIDLKEASQGTYLS